MNLTRTARSQLADPRRGFASILAVVSVVLTVLGVQILCGIHLDGGHGSAHGDAAAGHHATPAAVGTADLVAEPDHGHHGEDPNHCSEERTATARYDRTLSPFPDLAGVPVLAQQWRVPDLAYQGSPTPPGAAVTTAPSLHALGISRT
ncbi:hypothetical protein [Promicromonospora aerolata]|uniref:Uncharacterized protein n=1 Tax=Promicromonospora aerolata TaxID=195749 RepID=A0ABW4VCB1_9MICO